MAPMHERKAPLLMTLWRQFWRGVLGHFKSCGDKLAWVK